MSGNISYNVGAKQDYSYLFQSMSGSDNLNFISDYMSIKNGSYYKLMKAYYAKDGASEEVSEIAGNKNISTAEDSAKTLSTIQSAADGLKESADTLISKGTDSVFRKVDLESTDENGNTTTTSGYDVDAIYKAVSGFVTDYNTLLSGTEDAQASSITNRTNTLVGATAANKTLLSKVGITINSDNSLSLDEETFKTADMTTVKSLFNGNSSYAYQVSAQASLIDYAAASEGNKSNTYTSNGAYSNAYSSGSVVDYLF